MKEYQRYFDLNKAAWNRRTPVHCRSKFYDLEGFKSGKSSLNYIELEEVGEVRGKSLLHLQCHFGQDTLSWARLGAEVTGADLSDAAIETAQGLAAELQLPAEFICANVLELDRHLKQQYDIIFTSYGVLTWLPDLPRWGEVIAKALKPGGFFYIVEFHPMLHVLDYHKPEGIAHPYFDTREAYEEVFTGTYTDGGEDLELHGVEWRHSISDIINALTGQGLRLEYFNEFPFSVYNCFPDMVEAGEGRWVFKDIGEKIPYLFSLKAWKL